MKGRDSHPTESSEEDSWSQDDSSTTSDGDDEPLKPPQEHASDKTPLFVGIALFLVVIAVAVFFVLRSSAFTSSLSTSSTQASASQPTSTTGSVALSQEGGTATKATASSTTAAVSFQTGASSDLLPAKIFSTAPSTNSSSSTKAALPPNGKKAGLAGGDGFDHFKDHIGWWYDWNANTGEDHTAEGVSYFAMLWGAGKVDDTDASRLAAFKSLSSPPPYILGFNEPDLDSSGSGDVVSSGIEAKEAAKLWEELIAPWGEKGSLLGSPAPAKQGGETWLGEFKSAISTDWDFTSVHIYQSTVEGVQKVIEHYVSTYSKPVVITEWGCVDTSSGFTAVSDQSLINSYIADCVELFEKDDNVKGYATIVQGSGLGEVWPLVNKNGELSETGKSYLEAISKYG